MITTSFHKGIVRIDRSRAVVSIVPRPHLTLVIFLAFAFTAVGLLTAQHTMDTGPIAIVGYGLVALVSAIALLPGNQRVVKVDLVARRVVIEGAYGNGRGTETRFEDLTFELEEGFTRRKYGRMAPWILLRAVVDAGTPDAQTLFRTSVADVPTGIAAVRELRHVLDESRRDRAASRDLDLSVLQARVADAEEPGRIAVPFALAMLLLPGLVALHEHLR